ncbi:Ubiquitin carboxyl-terminal hydrolase [Plasmodiophora brassicae]
MGIVVECHAKVAGNPLPRRLEFVKPRFGRNGVAQHRSGKQEKNECELVPVALQWAKPFGSACGLQNLGNTCFLNSVIQCLTHTAPLANLFLGGIHQNCRARARNQFCMLCFLQQHVPMALQGGAPKSPRHLVGNLRTLSSSFRPGRQEDSHEFLCKCLEAMQKSSPAAKIVDSIFGGRFRSQVRCRSCSGTSDAFDPFFDVSLELIRASSVQQALKHFTAPEILSGQNMYLCGKCHKRSVAEKRLTIDVAPPVLTIQLKRFLCTGAKINKPVQYGHYLDLAPFVSGKASGATYTLFGLVVHIGSGPRSGHYVAYVKGSNGTWYCMDDECVSKTSADNVLQQKPYLLFYSKNAPAGTPKARRPEPAPCRLPAPAAPSRRADEFLKSMEGDLVGRNEQTGVAAPQSVAASAEAVASNAVPPNHSSGGHAAISIGPVGGRPVASQLCKRQRKLMVLVSRQRQRYYPLHLRRPTPGGGVFLTAVDPSAVMRPRNLATWENSNDDGFERRVLLRQHQDDVSELPRTDWDVDYDRGRTKKVKRRRVHAPGNPFQHKANQKHSA